MTIDEAIKNLEYGIEQMTMELKSGLWETGSDTEAQVKQGIGLNQQLIAWLTELKESRKLLKLAVEDFDIGMTTDDMCEVCKFAFGHCTDKKCTWRYADEALKLIGDEPNGI